MVSIIENIIFWTGVSESEVMCQLPPACYQEYWSCQWLNKGFSGAGILKRSPPLNFPLQWDHSSYKSSYFILFCYQYVMYSNLAITGSVYSLHACSKTIYKFFCMICCLLEIRSSLPDLDPDKKISEYDILYYNFKMVTFLFFTI